MREWYRRTSAIRGGPATGVRDIEKVRASDAKRRGSERRKASSLSSSKAQRAKDPAKYKARTALGNAVRDGKIAKQPCVICGAEKVEAHHNDYSRPLEVIWFCRAHHKQHHGHLRGDYPLP